MNTTKYIKLILSVSACFILSIFLIMMAFSTDDTPKIVQQNPEHQDEEIIKNDNEISKEVSMPNSETEKYILRYNPDNDSVLLITKKQDGTEIVSNVDSINPYYLTKEDINALTSGIELTSREDMFILIEDFSS